MGAIHNELDEASEWLRLERHSLDPGPARSARPRRLALKSSKTAWRLGNG